MGTGAFRDAGAALERVARLTGENEQLQRENESLRADVEKLSSTGAAGRALRERDERRA